MIRSIEMSTGEGADRDDRSTHGSRRAGHMGHADLAATRAVASARALALLHLFSGERGPVDADHARCPCCGLHREMAMDQVGRQVNLDLHTSPRTTPSRLIGNYGTALVGAASKLLRGR